MLKKTVLTIFFIIFATSPLLADTIYLKNGNNIKGIVTKESDDSIEVQINIGALATFLRKDIERIEKDSDEKHADLESIWKSENEAREIIQKEKIAQIEEKKKAGLVQHDGKWVTPEEKERLQAASIVKNVEKPGSEKRLSSQSSILPRSDFSKKLTKKGEWTVKETENFSIIYQESSQAKIISDKAEYYFEKIKYDLGYEDTIKWDEKCQVYIVENIDKWKSFLEGIGFNVELVGGFVPNYEEKEMFLCGLSEWYLAVTFPHELSHLILREIAGRSTIPLWLNEGLANYEANITSLSNELLVGYIKKGKHFLLKDLLSMARYPEGKETRELFYAQSEKIVEFLITQYGRKKFKIFCQLVLKDRPFKAALSRVYGDDFKDTEDFSIKLVEYIVK